MRHFLFYDEYSGEEFIVGANNILEAKEAAKNWFMEPKIICEISGIEAEMSGLDEY